ncbi:Serine/threonine-protein kinase PknB [Gimesia panareensis]|uniref:Serine/threonine-protein kinase PknB n=1 Tax=Gimesia panareensis TaxID=2527978 RepID=A0A518FJQ9_9PLAN|nr:serine/threonine-protein kinase [Gimesia panareensis]QDV16598.1 Serine/threonine-protein kinase PknB [Gimesia panareensis]
MNFLKRLFSKEPRIPRVNIKQRFELIGRVGQGSMSKVWRARDYTTGRVVSLKILDKVKTEELEARFIGLEKPKEGEIAVQFNHPHIVKTYEHGLTTDQEQFLVMEFIEGYSLSFLVEAQNEDMKTNCLRYMIQLGEAIQYFHDEGWIHRDICPRNIMVNNDHELKLIDFGLVVPNTPPFLQPGNRTGTAAYMAPELIKRQKTSQKIDIFSYAVTCYEMLTRRLPWKAAETMEAVLQHINSPPEHIQNLLPDLDPRIGDTIMKGLELYPQDRWQTVNDMLEPLKQAFKDQQRAAPGNTSESQRTTADPARRKPQPDSKQARPKVRKKKKPGTSRQPGESKPESTEAGQASAEKSRSASRKPERPVQKKTPRPRPEKKDDSH